MTTEELVLTEPYYEVVCARCARYQTISKFFAIEVLKMDKRPFCSFHCASEATHNEPNTVFTVQLKA